MPICSFFVDDDRYSVPTMMFMNIRDRASARAFAKKSLLASPHHSRVEVRENDVLMFTARRKRRPIGAWTDPSAVKSRVQPV
jgi:hypothetical protein